MKITDVRLCEFVADANAFVHISVQTDILPNSYEHQEIAKRCRLASPLSSAARKYARIYGNIANFTNDTIQLEIREILGKEHAPEINTALQWLTREFPSQTVDVRDVLIGTLDGSELEYTKRFHTIVLTEVDAMKFRLMFSCSAA